jgi:hypothetical protein
MSASLTGMPALENRSEFLTAISTVRDVFAAARRVGEAPGTPVLLLNRGNDPPSSSSSVNRTPSPPPTELSEETSGGSSNGLQCFNAIYGVTW